MSRKWWTLLTVSVGTFMLLLDITVVNTALPSIQRDLSAGFTDVQWVIDAYTLSLAAIVLTAGSLADRLGRRRVFGIGLGIFSLASLAAGLAPDATFLNVSRAVQGIGGAAMFAVSLALVAQEFAAGRERATAMGIYGATIGISVAIGPLVGGAITSGLGWRWVFFVNVPVGAAAIALTLAKLRESRDPNATRIDWLGLISFSSALLMLVLALLRGNDEGWGSPLIVGLLAGAGLTLAAFAAIERRVAEPMLPLGLFRRGAFTGVQLAAAAVSASLFALFLYLTLYLQDYLGYSPLQAGLRYLPITIVPFLVAPVAVALMARIPARALMAIGLGGVGAGLALMAGLSANSSWTALLPGFIVAGIGAGLLNPVIADVAVSVVSKDRSGMAAGINDTFRQVAIAVGVAAWGAIFLARGADKIASVASGTPAATGDHPRQLIEAASGGRLGSALAGLPHGTRDLVAEATRQGFLSGLNTILLLGALLAFAGAALAAWLVREHEIEREPLEVVSGPTVVASVGR
ncbi:MAG TPA: MFS transporter [Solirubrobacteraceae bacterium]|nr:MFS transporter [Solirubrobacteraceae bacterium]